MKKLFILIIMASLTFNMQAQDITNTLGSSGNFIIKDNSGSQIFKLNSTPHIYLGNNSTGYKNTRTLNILDEGGSAGISLSSYKGTGFSARSRIEFYTNQGSVNTPVATLENDDIGWLDFYGNDGTTTLMEGAAIYIKADADASSGHSPMRMEFKTDGGSGVTTRMTIKSDGRVNIATLLNITPGSAPASPQEGDVYCNSSNHHIYFYNGTTWKQLDN